MSDLAKQIENMGKALTAGGIAIVPLTLVGHGSGEVLLRHDAMNMHIREIYHVAGETDGDEIIALCRSAGSYLGNTHIYLKIVADALLTDESVDSMKYWLFQEVMPVRHEQFKTAEPDYDGCFFK